MTAVVIFAFALGLAVGRSTHGIQKGGLTMETTCEVCRRRFRPREYREDDVRRRLECGLPIFCSRRCDVFWHERQCELDIMTARGEKPAGAIGALDQW